MSVSWRTARVAEVVTATPRARLLRLHVPGWGGNLPGQHLDVRLTAEDGYQAVRSYSIASAGPGDVVELGVEEVPDGEVSPYLVGVVEPGDEMEVKGPLGGYFVWDADDPSPVQLVAGGSGLVPLVAMARARATTPAGGPFRLLYSVRTPADAMYAYELDRLAAAGTLEVTWAHTRQAPSGAGRPAGRLTADEIGAATWPPADKPLTFVCGPTSFVEAVADTLVAAGHDPARVRTERFGG